jgi:hypothetical protein
MPKIPTFESKGRLTAEAPSVKTGIQMSPTATPAAALLPAVDTLVDYSIKKRDIAEKVESQKIVNTIKGDLDITIEQQKDNINEDNALSNLEKSYKLKINEKISNIDNKRIKERVKNLLDLEYSGYVNKIKKNSYLSLEKETEKTTNETLTSIAAEYNQATTDEEKAIIRNKGVNVISTVADDFLFPENKKKEKLDAFDRVLLFGTFNSIAGTENAVENIVAKDKEFGGEKTNTNEEFSAGVLNAYETKIKEITIKGDVNADYDKAKQMIEELKTIKRSNGFKLDQGVVSNKIDQLEEKLISEKIQHENILETSKLGKELNSFKDEQKQILNSSFYNAMIPGRDRAEDREKSIEAQNELDARVDNYLKLNPEASLDEKKEYIKDIRRTLSDKYQEINIEKYTTFSLDQNKFNLIQEERQINTFMTKYLEDPNSEEAKVLKTLAKLNGYVDKNGQGNVTEFYNEYSNILANANPNQRY